jgi:hypothetical protein
MSINATDVKDILDVQSILTEAKLTGDEELLASLVNWKNNGATVAPASDFNGDLPAKAVAAKAKASAKPVDNEPEPAF